MLALILLSQINQNLHEAEQWSHNVLQILADKVKRTYGEFKSAQRRSPLNKQSLRRCQSEGLGRFFIFGLEVCDMMKSSVVRGPFRTKDS